MPNEQNWLALFLLTIVLNIAELCGHRYNWTESYGTA